MKKRWWMAIIPGILGILLIVMGQGVMGPIQSGAQTPRYLDFDLEKEGLQMENNEILGMETVYLAGFFNDWRADEAYALEEVEPGKWEIYFPFNPGRTEYKFTISVSGQDANAWVYDVDADGFSADEFGGENSFANVPDYEFWVEILTSVGFFFLIIGLIVLGIIPLGRALSQAPIDFKFKLYIPILVLWVLGSIVFIWQGYQQQKGFIEEIFKAQLNGVHRILDYEGVDFTDLDVFRSSPESDHNAKVFDRISETTLAVGIVQAEGQSWSNTQSFIYHLYILDETFTPISSLSPQFGYVFLEEWSYMNGYDNQISFLTDYLLAQHIQNHGEEEDPRFYWVESPGDLQRIQRDNNADFYSGLIGEDMFLLPFKENNRIEGYYFGIFDPSVLGRRIMDNILANSVVTLALLIAITILIFSLSSEMVNNLLKLIHWVRKIKEGEFGSVRLLETHDEIQDLAESVDSMRLTIRKSLQEISDLNVSYKRFLPEQFLQSLERESVTEIQLGDQVEREMTVLFCDIRNFTALSEKITPDQTFALINQYLRYMEPEIQGHGGFVDKYMGDGIMALFPQSPDQALLAAQGMMQALGRLNEDRANDPEASPLIPPLEMGIGINTGRLILGIVGGTHRLDGTVISDAVNLASRLESLTKESCAKILISDYTLQSLEDKQTHLIRPLGQAWVKGKSDPVRIHELLLHQDLEQMEVLKESADLLERFFEKPKGKKARKALKKYLKDNPWDEAVEKVLLAGDPELTAACEENEYL